MLFVYIQVCYEMRFLKKGSIRLICLFVCKMQRDHLINANSWPCPHNQREVKCGYIMASDADLYNNQIFT